MRAAAKEALGDNRCEDNVALGWQYLCEGTAPEAEMCFEMALEVDPLSAAARNGRGIANEILGKSGEAQVDYAQADKLLEEGDREERERLQLARKQWKPVDFEARTARGEPEGTKVASEADFLISFVTPSGPTNNLILHQLGQGVHFKKEFRTSVSTLSLAGFAESEPRHVLSMQGSHGFTHCKAVSASATTDRWEWKSAWRLGCARGAGMPRSAQSRPSRRTSSQPQPGSCATRRLRRGRGTVSSSCS